MPITPQTIIEKFTDIIKQSNNRLAAYNGKLTASDISYGINIANANAKRLADDAEILLTAGRIPTAASLAVLSIEESGKVTIFRQLATSTTNEINAAWKSYRNHVKKNSQWLLLDLALNGGAKTLDDFRPLFDENEHAIILDNIKQLGFYTDCLGDKNWSIPEQFIDEELACYLVKIAKLLVGKREITLKEIELWIEYLGNVPTGDLNLGKEALIRWYAAMQEAGLYKEGVNGMETFITEGITLPKISRHE